MKGQGMRLIILAGIMWLLTSATIVMLVFPDRVMAEFVVPGKVSLPLKPGAYTVWGKCSHISFRHVSDVFRITDGQGNPVPIEAGRPGEKLGDDISLGSFAITREGTYAIEAQAPPTTMERYRVRIRPRVNVVALIALIIASSVFGAIACLAIVAHRRHKKAIVC